MKPSVPDPDDNDERRSDKRRYILMPIENERRRGRDRRTTWELTRSSSEVDALPMARLSDPRLATAVPLQPFIDDTGTKVEFLPSETSAPETKEPAPKTAAPADTVPAARPADSKPQPVLSQAVDQAKAPPAKKIKPKRRNTAPRVQPPEAIAFDSKPPPVTAPVTRKKIKSKPAPRNSDVAPLTPSTAVEAPPKQPAKRPSRAAFAHGEMWIGVPLGTTDEFLTAPVATQTHRFVNTGGQRLLITLCHGPVATVYRAWRPVKRKTKHGQFMQAEDQLYQLVGSKRGTESEFRLAHQTIFEGFPEVKDSAVAQKGVIITIDV